MATPGEIYESPFDDKAEIISEQQLDDELWLLLEQYAAPDDEADPLFEQVLEARRHVLGELAKWSEEHGMLRLVDDDADKVMELYDRYMEAIRDQTEDQMLTDPKWKEIYGTSVFYPYLQVECLMRYFEERDFQEHLVSRVTETIVLCADDDISLAGYAMSDYNKAIHESSLETVYPEHFTQGWREFLDYILPSMLTEDGERILPADNVVSHEVNQFVRVFQQIREFDHQVLSDVLKLAGVDRSVYSEENARMIFALKVMQEIASGYYKTTNQHNGRAERNRNLCTYGQAQGFDSELLGKVTNYLDEAYPIESIRNK